MVETKIICTIGPASSTKTLLKRMMLEGMDVARLNFSHGNHSQQLKRMRLVRQLNKGYRRHIRVLQDLQGYRIRIGRFKDSVAGGKKEIELKKKQEVILTNKNILGQGNVIPFDYSGDLKDITIGSHIYIDDGNIALSVRGRQKYYLKTEVIIPGVLKENKGVNIPDVNLKIKGLTHKDRIDIEFGIENQMDYIAQSFVRDRKDVLEVRRLVQNRSPECKIIAKIENRQGIDNIDEIIDASDGIMIARGDMGVSIPIYEVPIVQKQIIKKCNQAKKFVITATQMLESMVENIRPTRAEVADVANAILDGSNFLMLSAETATGVHPVEAVRMMNEIIKFTESKMHKNLNPSTVDKILKTLKLIERQVQAFRIPSVTVVSERKDPYLVLISCILSLRTKDATTIQASRRLFKVASTPYKMAKLPASHLERLIYPVGFYRNKAKAILEVSRKIIEDFSGRVPDRLEELLSLKGVGRKTANLVLGLAYKIPAICVDTHVHRVSNRLGWVKTKVPEKTEIALKAIIAKDYWINLNTILVTFGQNLCLPVSPYCSRCSVAKFCKKVGVNKFR